MSLELVHASVERGLRGGSGFATAVATRGMPAQVEQALAEQSAYDFNSARAVGADRVEWAHRVLTVQGKSHTVLTRIAPCGSDWSGRPNRVAHHLVLEPAERAASGPAAMLAAFTGFGDTVPSVEERGTGPALASGSARAARAVAWEAAGYDPGFAGVLAQIALESPQGVCYVVFDREVSALPLLAEALALLPAERRWHTTFSTRFARVSSGARCQIRCVRAGSEGLARLLAEPGVRILEVSKGASAGDSPSAQAGRDGTPIDRVARAPASGRVTAVLMQSEQVDELPEKPRNSTHAGVDAESRGFRGDAGEVDRSGRVEAERRHEHEREGEGDADAEESIGVLSTGRHDDASESGESTAPRLEARPAVPLARLRAAEPATGPAAWRSPFVLGLLAYSAVALAVAAVLLYRATQR